MNIITFVSVLGTLIISDFIWLGFIASNLYKNQLGDLMKNSFSLLPAIVVYVLITFGILVFILPLITQINYITAFIYGAFFGLVLYGVYDLTNLSIIKNWPLLLTFVDIVWGSFVVGLGTLVAKLLN